MALARFGGLSDTWKEIDKGLCWPDRINMLPQVPMPMPGLRLASHLYYSSGV